jgi:filamentous hemagglutinin
MTARISFPAICATLFATVCCTAPSFAARAERARLTIAGSKVSVAGQPVAAGATIAAGDTIVTGSGSRAELTLPDGTVVRIGQGSAFTYAGPKLVLNKGTALFRVAHKNTTVTSGSRTYTGGPAVVSAQAANGHDGLFVLQGSGKVNGIALIAGQSSVLEKGKERTFTFDLQKLVGSSALVTKFPQTPWIAQAGATASVQHQLLTAKITPPHKGAQGGVAGGNSSRVPAQDIVSSSLARLVSTGAAGTSVASRSGVPGNFQFAGGPVSLGANLTAVIKSAVISSATNGGTLQISGALINTGGVTVTSAIGGAGSNAALLAKAGAGTLNLNTGGTLSAGNSGAVAANTNNFVLTTGTSNSILAGVTTGNTLAGGTTGGALTIAGGTNTITNTGTGTLTVATGGLISGIGGLGTLNLAAGTQLGTLNYQPGTNLVVGGVTLPQVPGQTVTINGVNYISTQTGGAGGSLGLQQVAH